MEIVKPTIGRIVHFILPNGEHRPAFIVRVWPNEYGNEEIKDGVNLQVFIDGTNDYNGSSTTKWLGPTPEECKNGCMWRTSVKYSNPLLPENTETWHWPER